LNKVRPRIGHIKVRRRPRIGHIVPKGAGAGHGSKS
jgi:hypothetical protein